MIAQPDDKTYLAGRQIHWLSDFGCALNIASARVPGCNVVRRAELRNRDSTVNCKPDEIVFLTVSPEKCLVIFEGSPSIHHHLEASCVATRTAAPRSVATWRTSPGRPEMPRAARLSVLPHRTRCSPRIGSMGRVRI